MLSIISGLVTCDGLMKGGSVVNNQYKPEGCSMHHYTVRWVSHGHYISRNCCFCVFHYTNQGSCYCTRVWNFKFTSNQVIMYVWGQATERMNSSAFAEKLNIASLGGECRHHTLCLWGTPVFGVFMNTLEVTSETIIQSCHDYTVITNGTKKI